MIVPYVAIAFLVLATLYSAIVSFRRTSEDKGDWLFPHSAGLFSRIAALVVTVALVSGIVYWVRSGPRHSNRRPARILIPEGYTGWIRIEFEVTGAPPIPVENGVDVFKIPSDGLLRTSSPEQYGLAEDHYYYETKNGERPLSQSGEAAFIWGKINGEQASAAGKQTYEELFVGTAQQFRSQAQPQK